MNLLVLLTSFTLSAGPAPAAPTDSIGVEVRGGQRFVRHRVAKGESFYALARRYNVRLDQLQAANPQLTSGLTLGQVVLVPRGAARATTAPAGAAAAVSPRPATATATVKAGATSPAAAGRHTVAKGETLFGIARRYNLAPTELIRINKLPANAGVRVGQQLLLTDPDAGAAAPNTAAVSTPTSAPAVAAAPAAGSAPAAAPAPARTPAPAVPAPAPAREEPIATVTPAASPVERREQRVERDRVPTRASEVIGRVTESGLAAVIEKTGTDKYLALHKTAPVGMIMQVKNAMNGQSVYVRVIGRLPDTGENSNVLVRLSPRAVQKLGTPDARFRVETSYMP